MTFLVHSPSLVKSISAAEKPSNSTNSKGMYQIIIFRLIPFFKKKMKFEH